MTATGYVLSLIGVLLFGTAVAVAAWPSLRANEDPAQAGAFDKAIAALRAFCARWQEFGWIAGVLVLLFVGYHVIPRIDPRSGMDGWGAVWGMFVLLLGLFLAGFVAWLFQRLYFRELSDLEEEALAYTALGIADPDEDDDTDNVGDAGPLKSRPFITEEDRRWRGRHAIYLLLIDRALWLIVFVIAFAALAGLR